MALACWPRVGGSPPASARQGGSVQRRSSCGSPPASRQSSGSLSVSPGTAASSPRPVSRPLDRLVCGSDGGSGGRALGPAPSSAGRDQGGIAAASRVSRAKMCVCGASSHLGRERSRLLKAETAMLQRLRKLTEREEEFNAFDDSILEREDALRERREQLQREELEIAACLDASPSTTLADSTGATGQSGVVNQPSVGRAAEIERRRELVAERSRALAQRRRDLQRKEQRLQKRMEHMTSARKQLTDERQDVGVLREKLDEEAKAVETAREVAATAESALHERRAVLAQLCAEADQERDAILSRHGQLEPIQSDLQAKEADLAERSALLDRRKISVAEREKGLERMRKETSAAVEREAKLRSDAEEVEQRLTRLWDDIHQRQQLLEDIDTSLLGRERRVDAQQRSLAQTRATNGAPVPEAEQTRLELAAAELAERAWRERSASLADREAELRARVQLFQEQAERSRD